MKRFANDAGTTLGGETLQRRKESENWRVKHAKAAPPNPFLVRCLSEVPESVSSEEADVLSASNSM